MVYNSSIPANPLYRPNGVYTPSADCIYATTDTSKRTMRILLTPYGV